MQTWSLRGSVLGAPVLQSATQNCSHLAFRPQLVSEMGEGLWGWTLNLAGDGFLCSLWVRECQNWIALLDMQLMLENWKMGVGKTAFGIGKHSRDSMSEC